MIDAYRVLNTRKGRAVQKVVEEYKAHQQTELKPSRVYIMQEVQNGGIDSCSFE